MSTIRVTIGGHTFTANKLEDFEVRDVQESLPDCARLEHLTDIDEIKRRESQALDMGDSPSAEFWKELAQEMRGEEQ